VSKIREEKGTEPTHRRCRRVAGIVDTERTIFCCSISIVNETIPVLNCCSLYFVYLFEKIVEIFDNFLKALAYRLNTLNYNTMMNINDETSKGSIIIILYYSHTQGGGQ
jgi:hypothetical protein